MAEVRALTCITCGAPLVSPGGARQFQCGYCGRALVLVVHEDERDEVRDCDSGKPASLAAQLLRTQALRQFDGRTVGVGQRYSTGDMRTRDWKCHERGIWPIGARASSQFGGGWGADAIIGAPRVYPSCGDRMGAWAPRSRDSRTEWIEATYPQDAPPASAIRVFETCIPGATFAVTVQTADNPHEELVWQGEPHQAYSAQVLEIELEPARQVRRVRAYVDNSISTSWSEIDTICLVATRPIPEAMRRRPPLLSARGWVLSALAAVALTLALVPTCIGRGGPSDVPTPTDKAHKTLPSPTVSAVAAGVTPRDWSLPAAELASADVTWAQVVHDFSSQYGTSQWSAQQTLGAPNVYPRHGDIGEAWAPLAPDGGVEWIDVGFAREGLVRAIVIVQTFNPSAVIRIDDTTRSGAHTVLWQRERGQHLAPKGHILRLDLAQPSPIDRLRVVLDTKSVKGWNELDAIGIMVQR